MPTPKNTRFTVATPAVHDAVLALTARHGVRPAAKLLGLNQETVLRILSGQPVQRGSIALVTASLAAMHPAAPASPPPQAA